MSLLIFDRTSTIIRPSATSWNRVQTKQCLEKHGRPLKNASPPSDCLDSMYGELGTMVINITSINEIWILSQLRSTPQKGALAKSWLQKHEKLLKNASPPLDCLYSTSRRFGIVVLILRWFMNFHSLFDRARLLRIERWANPVQRSTENV